MVHTHSHSHDHAHTHAHGPASPHPAQLLPWSILRMTVASRVITVMAISAALWTIVLATK